MFGLRWRKSDQEIEAAYVEAARTFADAVSHLYSGEPLDKAVKKLHDRWRKAEWAYAKRGYRTVELASFRSHPLPAGVGVKREPNEPPVYYAVQYLSKRLQPI